jgi:hypothetical protein
MSAFYVGQRVRIRYARNPNFSHLEACEGVVTHCGPWKDGDTLPTGMLCDGIADFMIICAGVHGTCVADQLEPIIDPGHEVTTWEACGFHPSEFAGVEA